MLNMLPTQWRSCACLSSRVASRSTALRPVSVCRAAPAPQPRLRQQRPQWHARQGEQRYAILCAAAAAEIETAELDADEDADAYADLSEAERSQLDLEAADFAAAEIAVSLKNVYEGMVSDDFLQVRTLRLPVHTCRCQRTSRSVTCLPHLQLQSHFACLLPVMIRA